MLANDPQLEVAATCAVVPVFFGDSLAVSLHAQAPVDVAAVRLWAASSLADAGGTGPAKADPAAAAGSNQSNLAAMNGTAPTPAPTPRATPLTRHRASAAPAARSGADSRRGTATLLSFLSLFSFL
mgnify:CR=1 FL=1